MTQAQFSQLKSHLANPKRSYDAALSLYNIFKMDRKKDAFFASAKDRSFGSMPFQMLDNELKRIYRKLSANPVFEKEPPKPIGVKPTPLQVIPAKCTDPETLNITLSKTKQKPPVAKLTHYNITKPAASPDRKGIQIFKNDKVDYNSLPKDMQLLYDKNVKDYSLLKSLHAEMRVSTDQARNKQLAGKITKLEEEIQFGWKKLDEFSDGKLPEEKKETEADIIKQAQANIRFIQRNKENPKKVQEVNRRRQWLKEKGY